jgi:hypothetical protein
MQFMAVLYRDLLNPLLRIVRVVEKSSQLDAAMPKLQPNVLRLPVGPFVKVSAQGRGD